ncbi:SCA7-domain-containing protein, partial [Saccharata proteae CBS 121410]
SPLINPLPEKIAAAFPTGRPLDDQLDTVQCRHCRRPVLRTAAKDHIKECLDKKQAKLKKKKEAKEAKEAALRREKGLPSDVEDGPPKNARKSAKGALDDTAKKGSKKRKADGDAEKAPNAKKKKKDEPKPKTGKSKGPVDVEKQCGVLLANGAMCARSLTCKSHSMGAKRAVPGRSLPYDMLLAQYQKKNQAKQQRAAIDANAPLADDEEGRGPFDSDEEKDAIMSAIARSNPKPLVTRPLIATKTKYQYIRMKELLHNALGGSRGAGLFSTGQPPPQADGVTSGLNQRGGFLGGLFGGAENNAVNPFNGMAGTHAMNNGGAGGDADANRRNPSTAGPRQILPGQLPGPPPSRKQSVSSNMGNVG